MAEKLENLDAQREKVAGRLMREGLFVESLKLRDCGRPLTLICTTCGNYHEAKRHCNRRYCPPCSRTRAIALCDRYGPVIERMPSAIFLTLTQPHAATDDVENLLSLLTESVKRFRKLRWFKAAVRGGVGAIEVAKGRDSGWHIHWHGILDCDWLSVSIDPPRSDYSGAAFRRACKASQLEVAHQWALCSRVETAHVWVKRAKPGTVREVLKYSVSPDALLSRSQPLAPLIAAMTGRHFVASWGSVRKLTKQMKDEDIDESTGLQCSCGDPSWDVVCGDGLPRNRSAAPVPQVDFLGCRI